jgi:hypothetical protein
MARHFVNGSSQYLTRAGAAQASRPLSLACWAKPSTIVANACLFAVFCDNGNSGGYYLRVDGTTHARLMDYDSAASAIDAISSGSFSAGTWAHVVGTVAASGNIVYLNGVASSSVTPNTRATVPTPRTDVGALFASPAENFFWDGDLAECAIWNIALAPADVTLLAAGKSPALVQPGALMAYYKLLGTTAPEPDEKGGTGLTVTGATAATHPPIDYGGGTGRMLQVF